MASWAGRAQKAPPVAVPLPFCLCHFHRDLALASLAHVAGLLAAATAVAAAPAASSASLPFAPLAVRVALAAH